MYCPKCKTEYVEGVLVCADCEVPLVAHLPEEPSSFDYADHRSEFSSFDYKDYEEIPEVLNAGDIAIIKSLLDSESIDYFIEGEFSPYGIHRLMVLKDQVEDVKEILKDLEIEGSKITKPKDWHED